MHVRNHAQFPKCHSRSICAMGFPGFLRPAARLRRRYSRYFGIPRAVRRNDLGNFFPGGRSAFYTHADLPRSLRRGRIYGDKSGGAAGLPGHQRTPSNACRPAGAGSVPGQDPYPRVPVMAADNSKKRGAPNTPVVTACRQHPIRSSARTRHLLSVHTARGTLTADNWIPRTKFACRARGRGRSAARKKGKGGEFDVIVGQWPSIRSATSAWLAWPGDQEAGIFRHDGRVPGPDRAGLDPDLALLGPRVRGDVRGRAVHPAPCGHRRQRGSREPAVRWRVR